jgi:hypothetical protein
LSPPILITDLIGLVASGSDPGPLAHVGHWAVNLLYLGPIVLVALALVVSSRARRAHDDEESSSR